MVNIADPICRVLLFVFSVIALGLTGGWVKDTDSPRVEFAVFAAAFGVVVSLWGLLADFVEFFNFPVVTTFLDFCNWVFLFTGATAIAAKIRCHSCNTEWYRIQYFDGSKRNCRLAQAGCAFLYFAWFVALICFIVNVLGLWKGDSRIGLPGRRRATPRTGVPTMSQV